MGRGKQQPGRRRPASGRWRWFARARGTLGGGPWLTVGVHRVAWRALPPNTP